MQVTKMDDPILKLTEGEEARRQLEVVEKKKGNLWDDVRREITKIREKKVVFLHAKPVRI